MPFDPVLFLGELGLDYEVQRNNAYTACVWCREEGGDAKGNNWGFNLDGKRWGCWKNASHTGSLITVIRKFSGWSFEAATEYVGTGIATSPLDSIRARLAALAPGKLEEAPTQAAIEFPAEFRVPRRRGISARFYSYLEGRGFDDVPGLATRYGLRVAVTGSFTNRVILPVYRGHVLLGWTARAIGPAKLRYVAFPLGGQIKRGVFNGQNAAAGGKTLVICEGPFDALKLDWYGHTRGLVAVALMGTYATAEQADVLGGLASGFDRTVIMLDATARSMAMKLRASLPSLGAAVVPCPEHVKDPGELSAEGVYALARSLATRV